MADATVKPANRRRPVNISTWLTKQQHALLMERAAQLGVSKSDILQAAIWATILHPETISLFTREPSGEGATSTSVSGSRQNSTMRYGKPANDSKCTAATSSVAPSPSHFSPQVGAIGVIQSSEWSLWDVGGWHTLLKKGRNKNLLRHGLHAVCGRAFVSHAGRKLREIVLLCVPKSSRNHASGPQLPRRQTSHRSTKSITRNLQKLAGQRAYNRIRRSSPITIGGGVA